MHFYKKRRLLGVMTIVAGSFLGGCESFLNTDLDTSQVDSDKVFSDDLNATAAVVGMYANMLSGAFAAGGSEGISALTGMSSDELHNVMLDPFYTPFEENRLLEDDAKVSSLWTTAYQSVYQANDILESLGGSNLTPSVRDQLRGEALFVRAFGHFYLVNLFGDIPLMLTSDYKVNAKLPRQSREVVYKQIEEDLLESQSLLTDKYVDTERVRPNRATATALLSRMYLYRGDWERAAIEATRIIEDPVYAIVDDLGSVFLRGSTEVIWQLASDGPLNTTEGANFVMLYGPGSGSSVLSDKLLASFEANDARFSNWVGVYSDDPEAGDLYYPFKYKVADYDMPITEHFVVFRLAEQYLIRAEARARTGDLDGAISDIDVIRVRAGLERIQDTNPGVGQDDLLATIAHERQIEFFAEWGHRWFDLLRTDQADEVLSALKDDWSSNDQLYPIPLLERSRNPSLRDAQNPGY